MNGRLLLDANGVIAFFDGDVTLQDRLARADALFVPIIVLGELYYGALRSARPEENTARIDELVANTVVLPCDLETAQNYGRIKALLRAKGQPIPENDIWIAAIAQQHQLTLVSRDEHFKAVDGLELESW